ncbi:Subtilisin-like protease [Heracleum sosnowskyi]|uniref:Subtilisin-like protease n=1 Tax=Heracleum sosnowskyi TaxID=360622 RepID=A0AAD8N6Q3_9APIA|nr:Subtilisin-like protease [Heracleum sosnowskyi]
MARKSWNEIFLLLCSIIFFTATYMKCYATADEDRKVYIVYMGSLPQGEYSPSSDHLNILKEVTGQSFAANHLVRSYARSFNGFAARLTSKEVKDLSGRKEVVSVFQSQNYKLQTTRSWDFVGLLESVERVASVESDIIVGVIDTGIWPESESFSDEGFGPPPKKWKGGCVGGKNFKCNKKLIGARYYTTTDKSGARDIDGHGTHTASTAAGSVVRGANFYGLGKGNARGGVPSARIAAYKVCAPQGCEGHSILAAFDDAIADGVDILSVSIGPQFAIEPYTDSIAIASFHAMKQGVLTVQAAGNDGPYPTSVASTVPWLLSVAASTTDRRIIDTFTLGNGKTLIGSSINGFELNNTMFPLVYGKDIQKHTKECNEDEAKSCQEDCVDERLVKGKIVVCNSQFVNIRETGALGSILVYDSVNYIVPEIVSLPGTSIDTQLGNKLISYINSTKMPLGSIRKSEEIRDVTAPVVASFSSRGPNIFIPDILKPDITAPGVNILAAYSPLGPVSFDKNDKRSVNFKFEVGTSMACPHVAGSAAYVKSFHPSWSPSAIKSALLTTAWRMNATNHPDRAFAYGAGHIDPVRAVDPGLVYEAFEADYLNLLCNVGYTVDQIKAISGDENASCEKIVKGSGGKELNYPTITGQVKEKTAFNIRFPRTVTNVGHANSTYRARVFTNQIINVNVVPDTLSFKSVGDKKSFVVEVAGRGLPKNYTVWGSLEWSDGIHRVRSPVTLYTPVAYSSVERNQ